MKKSELIAELNKIEGDPEVLVSRDEEGNGFRVLYEVSNSYAIISSNYYDTEVYEKRWSFEDAGFDSKEEWEEFKSDPEHNVIVLWP